MNGSVSRSRSREGYAYLSHQHGIRMVFGVLRKLVVNIKWKAVVVWWMTPEGAVPAGVKGSAVIPPALLFLGVVHEDY